MKKLIYSFTILALAITLNSCCGGCSQKSPKIGELESSKWQLVELANQDVAHYPIVMTFDPMEKMIYGSAPCNNFFASYELLKGKKNNIRIFNGGATRKFCPDAQIEDKLAMIFETIVTIQQEENNILMLDADGELLGILRKK